MAEPITWRNVGGGGGGNPAALLAMGQNQVQQGLSALGGLFRDEQKLQIRNSAQVRENNTSQYLDAVANAGGVDALQNPETRAQLEGMRAGFGAAIDRDATRGAIDNRVKSLQQQTMVDNQFTDQATERQQRGLVDQGLELAQAGDMQGVQKLLADTQFLDEGKVANNLMGILDAKTRRQYAAEDQQRQDRAEGRQIAQFQESMAAASENRLMRKEALADSRQERAFRNGARTLDDAAEQAKTILNTRLAGNEWANTSTDPGKDAAVLLKGLTDSGKFTSFLNSDKTDIRQMQEGVTDLLSTGVDVDGQTYKVPPALLQQVINQNSKNWNLFDNPMDSIRNDLRNSLSGNAGAGNRAKVREAQTVRDQANNVMQTLKRAKTQLGTSSTLDTSGIVQALAELAGQKPVTSSKSNQNLLPNADEDIPDSWPPKGQVTNIQ
jgi:hypothetical protein